MKVLKAGILFDKVLILERITDVIVGFITTKEDFKKVKSELEKYGTIFTEELSENEIRVEVKTQREYVHKILKIIRDIPLFEIGKIFYF